MSNIIQRNPETGRYPLALYGETLDAEFRKARYALDDSLAIVIWDYSNGYPERYGNATVHLGPGTRDEFQNDRCAYLDENGMPGISEFLTNIGAAIPLGFSSRSGYCNYPAYEFKREWLASLKYDY